MFRLMWDQWTVTKGVREIVIMAEEDGFLMPSKREAVIKDILQMSREMKIATKGLPAHTQVMIVTMVAFGVLGPVALDEAARWAGRYAARHQQGDVLADCVQAATKLVEASE